MASPDTHDVDTLHQHEPLKLVVGEVKQGPFLPDDLDDDHNQRLLSLPPPPSYDVLVDNLSIGVPPHKAYIPTPIPIPIPQAITNRFSRHQKVDDSNTQSAADGRIIRNVTAHITAGQMMAIIGGSGSGKTTMLHAVANRLGGLPIVSGSVSFIASASSRDEDRPDRENILSKGMVSNVVGFVRQHDYLLPHLTGQ
jgi:hypothetical protein